MQIEVNSELPCGHVQCPKNTDGITFMRVCGCLEDVMMNNDAICEGALEHSPKYAESQNKSDNSDRDIIPLQKVEHVLRMQIHDDEEVEQIMEAMREA